MQGIGSTIGASMYYPPPDNPSFQFFASKLLTGRKQTLSKSQSSPLSSLLRPRSSSRSSISSSSSSIYTTASMDSLLDRYSHLKQNLKSHRKTQSESYPLSFADDEQVNEDIGHVGDDNPSLPKLIISDHNSEGGIENSREWIPEDEMEDDKNVKGEFDDADDVWNATWDEPRKSKNKGSKVIRNLFQVGKRA